MNSDSYSAVSLVPLTSIMLSAWSSLPDTWPKIQEITPSSVKRNVTLVSTVRTMIDTVYNERTPLFMDLFTVLLISLDLVIVSENKYSTFTRTLNRTLHTIIHLHLYAHVITSTNRFSTVFVPSLGYIVRLLTFSLGDWPPLNSPKKHAGYGHQ